jgi:hypothetical protein
MDPDPERRFSSSLDLHEGLEAQENVHLELMRALSLRVRN